MEKKTALSALVPVVLVLLFAILLSAAGSRVVTTLAQSAPIENRRCIVLDAGHGGEDGGAASCTGARESDINLEISLRLNDLLQLLGYDTVMIRTTDRAVYTGGDTIAQKKVSDLKERARIVNAAENALLISIHQNQFPESRYDGAQVFYAHDAESEALAKALQANFVQTVNPGSNRQCKRSDGVYLMEHITCPGVLIECGFLSNPVEEAKLRTRAYQQSLCCVIACTVSRYLSSASCA